MCHFAIHVQYSDLGQFWNYRGLDVRLDAIGHVATGDDRIAQRNTIAIVASQKQAGSFGFRLSHQITVSAKANVVLWDRSRIDDCVLENGLALNAQKNPQIVPNN